MLILRKQSRKQRKKSRNKIINEIGGKPITKTEIVRLIAGKADKTELYNNLRMKMNKNDILKQQKLILALHNYLKHLVVFNQEMLRNRFTHNIVNEHEQVNNEAHLTAQIQEIYKLVCKLDQEVDPQLKVEEVNPIKIKTKALNF